MEQIKIIKEAIKQIAHKSGILLRSYSGAAGKYGRDINELTDSISQALAQLEQQDFERKISPDIKELMLADYTKCMKKTGLHETGKFLSSYFEQPTVNEALIKEIEFAKLNDLTIKE